jgi:outer membrane protein OmpA-like peptidoglycan-associated protein
MKFKLKGVEMSSSGIIKPRFFIRMLISALCLFPLVHTLRAESDGSTQIYSPVVNGQALRGLSTISSAESMGAGRITFGVLASWFQQQLEYNNTPNADANVFTGVGSFSYGVNSYVDLFASVAGFGMSNYTKTDNNSGLGTIQAGVQGSLPFPKYAFIRMGGQTAIIGGTSQSQINSYRSDGYNYFETRTRYSFLGKLMQTVIAGNEEFGIKFHLNESGVICIDQREPVLFLMGAGLQANAGFVVLGAEINSRTRFNDLSFGTDPLWFTPTINIRTPYHMNVMVGVDVSLSTDRSDNNPRALEPYRVFGALAFSFDMLERKRKEALAQKQKEAQEKVDLEKKAALSENQVQSLREKSVSDSIANANQNKNESLQRDSMQRNAEMMAKKASEDSLALIQSAKDLAVEKEKRSDAEKQLLSTGELLLDAVYFKTGKTDISINSKPYLNIIGKMLLKYPKLMIEIGGHTDNVGGQEYNKTLSQGRADAVRFYLIETAPALSSNLSAVGYGMSTPKADNGTAKGRLSNRRVELRVTNKSALQEYSQK